MESPSKSKLIIFCILFAALLPAAKLFHVQEHFHKALDWIRGLGPLGAVVFIAIYVLACVFLMPAVVLTLGAGAAYGLLKGFLIVSLSSTLGATCAFLIGRTFARAWVEKRIASNNKFKAIDEAVAREGWKIVGLTRLSPVFPFNVINYAYGVTKVSLRDYVLASWIGMMPGTVLFIYIGSLLGSAGAAGSGNAGAAKAQWAFRVLGLVATVLATFFIARIAKKALDKQVSV